MTETCSLFDVSKQAYYKFNEQVFQTLLLREKMAIDYALSVRAIDPGIGGKKLHKMYIKELQTETPIGRNHFLRLWGERGLKLRKRTPQLPRTTDSRYHLE